jgi:hypothetical protein
MFKVLCTVQGGVTGYRQAYLKGYNGVEKTFVTRDEAQLEASGLQIQKDNATWCNGARYTYRVVEA